MRSWRQGLVEAVRSNPKLSGMLALELGLLLYAASRARRGKAAIVPTAQELLESLAALAAVALPFVARPHDDKRKGLSRFRVRGG
ncbi:MAG TPA: hypothetical protein VFB45_25330 [Pseudolabrys sp.]|nr:hypothetical protein [Pseudolabrys sp.]